MVIALLIAALASLLGAQTTGILAVLAIEFLAELGLDYAVDYLRRLLSAGPGEREKVLEQLVERLWATQNGRRTLDKLLAGLQVLDVAKDVLPEAERRQLLNALLTELEAHSSDFRRSIHGLQPSPVLPQPLRLPETKILDGKYEILNCILFVTICLVMGLVLIMSSPSGMAGTDCQRHFRGIEYCTADDGQTHIVSVDLTEANIRFDVATASNATGPNPPSWNADLRQTVAQMAAAHPILDGLPLAVAVNGDYFGASDGGHGWEGFTVQRGVRLDGPTTNAPDCDCASFDRSALALSRGSPIRAEIARRTPEELDQYDAYWSHCVGDPAFAGCQSAVLNRTPAADEAERFQKALRDRWYTAVGGGPIIVQDGQPIPISQACQHEKFTGDWCQDNPQRSPDRMRQLRMGTVAGITADGRRLILIVTTARLPNELSQLLAQQGVYTGIRFDGSESSQIVYNDQEKTGNTRRISNALLVYASPLPANDASLAEPAWPIIALPGDAVQATIILRNEGTATWQTAAGYALVNVKNPLGAPKHLSLPHDVPPGNTVTWTLPMTAPTTPGAHRSQWQLQHGDTLFGEKVAVWVGVLPEKAREWQAELDRLIEEARQKWEEARQRGEEEIERLVQELIDELEQRLVEIIKKETEACCAGLVPAGALMLVGVWLSRQRK